MVAYGAGPRWWWAGVRWLCGALLALAFGCDPSFAEGDPLGPDAAGSAEVDSEGAAIEPDARPEFSLARGGLGIASVQANQGVGVTIGEDGRVVSPAERAAPLLQGRVTLFRAFWTLPPRWEPREIEGRLFISYPDGSRETFSDTKLVAEPSSQSDLQLSFFWGLMEHQIEPGIRYRVELYETSPDHDALPAYDERVTLPVGPGDAPVGIEDGDQAMKVVVVPFDYDDGAGCATSPDTSEATMQRFRDLLYMQNPLDRLDFEVHPPVEWATPLDSFVPLNMFLAGLRFDEGAPPETYYYGLIDVCAGGLGGLGGLANGIPAQPVSPDAAIHRVASGLSVEPEWSAETFVHELGHCQGRHHVACSGDEGHPDPGYPYEIGELGQWGFGVVDFVLRHPTSNKDYMTYCHPTWVGSWGWNEVYPVIAGLSDWDDAWEPRRATGSVGRAGSDRLAPDPYAGSILVGAIDPGGRSHWITAPGTLPAEGEPRGARVRMWAGDELVAEVDARVQPLHDDGDGVLLTAPLPVNWDSVTEVAWADAQVWSTVGLDSIAQHHDRRAIWR